LGRAAADKPAILPSEPAHTDRRRRQNSGRRLAAQIWSRRSIPWLHAVRPFSSKGVAGLVGLRVQFRGTEARRPDLPSAQFVPDSGILFWPRSMLGGGYATKRLIRQIRAVWCTIRRPRRPLPYPNSRTAGFDRFRPNVLEDALAWGTPTIQPCVLSFDL